MKITLETVRNTLRRALGFDSFIAGFISEVREDAGVPTACITKEGLLRYNPDFVQEYISYKEDLFSLCLHEILHPMFGHFLFRAGEIEDIATDAIINATISSVFARHSHEGNLFQRFYPPKGIEGLLRPNSRMRASRYDKVYDALYQPRRGAGDSLSTGELIQTLKILTPTIPVGAIVLLGTHSARDKAGSGTLADSGLQGLPQDVLCRIAEEIRRRARENASGNAAGYSEVLMDLLMEALRTHLSIRRVVLQQFLSRRKVDRFRATFHSRRLTASPIPIRPSKRDLVLIAAGIHPFHFHNTLSHPAQQTKGLAAYLDVSGSVNDHLPHILGVLRNFRKEMKSIFLFSNKVVETSFESLLRGRVQTTWGTDFDCIAESLLERDFDKAVIITDGYASMNPELREQLKTRRLRTLTILFSGAQDCEDFAHFGDIVQLEDVCEER